MPPEFREWLRQWPGHPSDKSDVISWMDQCPLGRQLEGPNGQWARWERLKRSDDAVWIVDEHTSPHSGPIRVGLFTSQALYEHWEHKGLGLMCLRPALATVELHLLLTLGATGNFPQGQVSPDDEGELNIAVGRDVKRGIVSIDFGKQVKWVGFDPATADVLAQRLREHAEATRREAH